MELATTLGFIFLYLWFGLLLISYIIQKIIKFIDDDKSEVDNYIIKFIRECKGYKPIDQASKCDIFEFKYVNSSGVKSDCNDIIMEGVVVALICAVIITIGYYFYIPALFLCGTIPLIFGARYVIRLNKKITKLGH